MWGLIEQVRELKAEVERLRKGESMSRDKKLILLEAEIKAALGVDWRSRLEPFWVTRIAEHLIACGWLKNGV